MGLLKMPRIALTRYEQTRKGLPALVWVVLIATLISNTAGDTFFGSPIFGYAVSGFGWFIPLVVALYALITIPGSPRLPYWIWMPWIALTIAYLLVADAQDALQRTVMLLTPIAIGMAVSKGAMGEGELSRLDSLLDKISMAFFAAILVNSGLVYTGALPEVTGLAPQATTAALFGVFFAARFALGDRRAVMKWLLFAAVPVIAVTRTAILAAGLTLPFTFAPMPLGKRLAILIGVAALGFAVFNTQRVQDKMFFSGHGTIFDLSIDNPDLRTTGRLVIYEVMKDKIEEAPWFGHGANASEQFVSEHTGGLTHPHDDYLRLAFDYGYIGTLVFVCCMLLQTFHALRAGYLNAGATRLFLLAGAGAFLPFALIMSTDNIILYGAFFGNLHFTLLGAGYAGVANRGEASEFTGFGYR